MKTKLCTLVGIFGFTLLAGCAGAKLKTEWKEQRGYTDSDIAEIEESKSEYFKMLNEGMMASNRFNGGAPGEAARNRLKSIFCSCVKKMGDSCRKSQGSSIDHSLWVKANAIDYSIALRETALDAHSSEKLDPSECN